MLGIIKRDRKNKKSDNIFRFYLKYKMQMGWQITEDNTRQEIEYPRVVSQRCQIINMMIPGKMRRQSEKWLDLIGYPKPCRNNRKIMKRSTANCKLKMMMKYLEMYFAKLIFKASLYPHKKRFIILFSCENKDFS